MKLTAFTLLTCCATCLSSSLYSQDEPLNEHYMKVTTDHGIFKGSLTDISDSSISLLCRRPKRSMEISATSIYSIKFKKPFFKTIGIDIALGAGLAAILVTSYYLKYYFDTPDDPPYGRALWTSMAVCAGFGSLYGAVDAGFIKIKIPIKKDLFLFQNSRKRLYTHI